MKVDSHDRRLAAPTFISYRIEWFNPAMAPGRRSGSGAAYQLNESVLNEARLASFVNTLAGLRVDRGGVTAARGSLSICPTAKVA